MVGTAGCSSVNDPFSLVQLVMGLLIWAPDVNCVSPNSYVEVLTPSPSESDRDTTFKEVIKLK